MDHLAVADLETMTLDAGESWALTHVCRVLRLAEEIGVDITYDAFAFTVSAYLHDWGAFSRYQQPGVDHALRSRQVAEADILDFLGVIGMARVFVWGPNDLALCYHRILARRDALRNRFTLPRAQALAATRLARMEQCLVWLEEEGFGYL